MAPVTTLGPTLAEKIRNGGITHRTASSPTQAGQALGCPTKQLETLWRKLKPPGGRQMPFAEPPHETAGSDRRWCCRESLGATGDDGRGELFDVNGRRLAATDRVSGREGGQASAVGGSVSRN